MKRASSLVASAIVPVVVAFVLTARPARLYAESAPRPLDCKEIDTKSCEGKAQGDDCGDASSSSVSYRCQLTYCLDTEDGGYANKSKTACRYYAPPSPPPSGTSGPALGVPIADGAGATAGSASSDDGGCSAAGGTDGGRAWAAALGLFVMATAIKRRLRKA